MKNGDLVTFLMIALLSVLPTVQAQIPHNRALNPVPFANPQLTGWLGVTLRPVPEALAVQLGALLPDGQGVMVGHVEKNSPAAASGLQRFDILLSFDDQRLYTPGQLSSLVGSTAAGSKNTLQLIRGAQLKTQQVEIAQHPAPRMKRPLPRFFPPWPMQAPVMPYGPAMKDQARSRMSWDSFESVEVKTLADGRYHASVSYRDQGNETRTFSFEGSREEIIQQIRQRTDLPAPKRAALLNALNMDNEPWPLPYNAPLRPGGHFSSPFFQRHPLNDPFFREPFFQDPFFMDYPAVQWPPYFGHSMPPQRSQPGW